MRAVEQIGDAVGLEKREERIVVEESLLAIAFRNVLETPAGRHVLWWVLEQAHPYRSSYDPKDDSGRRTAFLEGERSLGLKVIDQIDRWCPERLRQMQEDARGRSTDPRE